jgi:hypothetical protein
VVAGAHPVRSWGRRRRGGRIAVIRVHSEATGRSPRTALVHGRMEGSDGAGAPPGGRSAGIGVGSGPKHGAGRRSGWRAGMAPCGAPAALGCIGMWEADDARWSHGLAPPAIHAPPRPFRGSRGRSPWAGGGGGGGPPPPAGAGRAAPQRPSSGRGAGRRAGNDLPLARVPGGAPAAPAWAGTPSTAWRAAPPTA